MSIVEALKENRSKLIEWLLQQGVSTILLCAILVFLGYGIIVLVPSHITLIQQGYEKNAASLEKTMEKVVQSHEQDREFFSQMLLESRKLGGMP